jgi:hypothetical protein
MEWENIGASGAIGFLASIITLLGWDRRMKKMEDKMVPNDLCDAKHKAVHDSAAKMSEDIAHIRSRVDKIFDNMINGK